MLIPLPPGIVAGISIEHRTIHIATPVADSDLAHVNVLMRGSMSLPSVFVHQVRGVVVFVFVLVLALLWFHTRLPLVLFSLSCAGLHHSGSVCFVAMPQWLWYWWCPNALPHHNPP